MELHIHRPLAFSELGERSTNQDFVYPPPDWASTSDRLFVVCDGIGGADSDRDVGRHPCRQEYRVRRAAEQVERQ